MKKILLSLLVAGSLFSSCDMNMEPYDSIPSKDYLTSASDCASYRLGFYSNLRTITGGAYIGLTELQMDAFYGVVNNGNINGPIASGELTTGDDDVLGTWAGCYSAIMSVNYFLGHATALLEDETLSEEDHDAISRYIGEAKFTRAYMYYYLMDHFCNSFSQVADPNAEGTGLPIVTVYNPTPDKNVYPGRSSLQKTFEFIEEDLTDALTRISEYIDKYKDTFNRDQANELLSPMAIYINPMTIKAFQCRLALLHGEYDTVITIGNEIIDCGLYPLATRANGQYEAMWTDDIANEIIFRPYTAANENCPNTGSLWNDDQNAYAARYIPVPEVANVGELYSTKNDVRYSTFVASNNLSVNGKSYTAPIFNKYPQNSVLGAFKHAPKPFRTSEVYLNMMEAYYEKNQPDKANDLLETLRKARILRYNHDDYAGLELRDEIRKERHRELIGEGFRMSDLRRWGLGFERTALNYSEEYADAATIVGVKYLIEYPAGNYKFVWPIPAKEIAVNPQLKYQQNPGY